MTATDTPRSTTSPRLRPPLVPPATRAAILLLWPYYRSRTLARLLGCPRTLVRRVLLAELVSYAQTPSVRPPTRPQPLRFHP
jgi:hypothetical protein